MPHVTIVEKGDSQAMKKFCGTLFLTALFFCSFFGTSKSDLRRMSDFITAFIEADYYNFDSRTITMDELLYFGIRHNCMNNYNHIEQVRYDSYDSAISAKYVEAAVRKYFALPVKHQNINYEGAVRLKLNLSRYCIIRAKFPNHRSKNLCSIPLC